MDTVHECDRQTDYRQTDGQTDIITITNTMQRIASHGKKERESELKRKNALSFDAPLSSERPRISA